MIIKFQNFKLITENPDTLYAKDKRGRKREYVYSNKQAKPFFFEVNDEHTKVENLYMGKYGSTHGDIKFPFWRDNAKAYAGRLWKNAKLLSFWVYPNEILFVDIIKHLEEKLKIKMFNNGWRIEIIKKDDKIKKRDINDKTNDFYFGSRGYFYNGNIEVIPIEDYIGSEDAPEEERILHMMNWKEKEEAKKAGKLSTEFGSTKTAWDKPHNIKYRQTIYQEKKENK